MSVHGLPHRATLCRVAILRFQWVVVGGFRSACLVVFFNSSVPHDTSHCRLKNVFGVVRASEDEVYRGAILLVSFTRCGVANVSTFGNCRVVSHDGESLPCSQVGSVVTPGRQCVLKCVGPYFVRDVRHAGDRRVVLTYGDYGFPTFVRGLRDGLVARQVFQVRP